MKLPQLSRSLNYTLKEGKILMLPSDRGAKLVLEFLKNQPMVKISTWAIHNVVCYRLDVDQPFPFSAQNDDSELLQYVKSVNPIQVDTMNGFPDLAFYLRTQAYQVEHFTSSQAKIQLQLFLDPTQLPTF